MKYYGVLNSYYNNGSVVADIMEVRDCEEKPYDDYVSTRRCDTYMNWFASEKEAVQFIKDCKKA